MKGGAFEVVKEIDITKALEKLGEDATANRSSLDVAIGRKSKRDPSLKRLRVAILGTFEVIGLQEALSHCLMAAQGGNT